jgi:amidase
MDGINGRSARAAIHRVQHRAADFHSSGRLFDGVPFLLKDMTVEIEGWPLTSGCSIFTDHIASQTTELGRRLENAGLVLFGRTASPELGFSTDTVSSLYGITRNPWDNHLSAGRSSGGSAAAVAAGIVPAAHAGDGGGSIRIPSALCGVFGMKPSRGRNPTGPNHPEGLF